MGRMRDGETGNCETEMGRMRDGETGRMRVSETRRLGDGRQVRD